MVTFLCATSGGGKTREVAKSILNDLENGIPVILLVPEQMAISAERNITSLAMERRPAVSTDGLEILNFTRLANRVFRTEGSLSYRPIGKGGQLLTMWKALASCAPYLTEYRSALVNPEPTADLMLSAVKQLQIYGITPDRLMQASDDLAGENPHFADRLKDIALLYQTYRHTLGQEFDDPMEQIPRLCRILSEKRLFSEYHIYFDSFHGLTGQELTLVKLLFADAKNCTFTLCRSEETKHLPAFSGVEQLFSTLKRFTKDYIVTELQGNSRFTNDAMIALRDNLFVQKDEQATVCGDHIRIFSCPDPYAQAEHIARDIARRVREEGCMYSDFAIVAQDASRYRGVIDSYLSRYDIPFFFSQRRDLSQLPLFRLILSLFAIKQYNFKYQDVKNLIKTGLTPLSSDDCDVLDSYASTWSISGRRWLNEDDWTNHPRGYLSEFTEEDIAFVKQANEARRALILPIDEFLQSFSAQSTVSSISRALYDFLIAYNVKDRLIEQESGNASLIWNTLIDVIDETVSVCADMKCDGELYARLLSMVISKTDMGNLPASVDEVVIGSASLLRTDDPRHVYLIGVNDGEFPARPSEEDFFSDSDKIALEGVGITLSGDTLSRTEDALFRFWRAAVCARESLTVCYAQADLAGGEMKPSIHIARLLSIFSDLTPIDITKQSPLSLLESPRADFPKIATLQGTAEGQALKNVFATMEDYASRLSAIQSPICMTEEVLNQDICQTLYPKNLTLSQTKLEHYVKCPFLYHCTHTLKLEKQAPAVIGGADTGQFVHHVLEKFFRSIRTEDGINKDLSDEQIEEMIDQIISDYLATIFGGVNRIEEQSERLLSLFRRLKRITLLTVKHILEELSHSSFVPAFFELPISFGEEENAVRPMSIPLPDGTKVHLIGRIDRVDTFVKDNKIYLRIVDYKSGEKTINLKRLQMGLDLQMLLYLFALWNNTTPEMKEMMGGGKDAEIIPAAAVYCMTTPQKINLSAGENPANVVPDGFKRSGMYLYDGEILAALDDTESMRYLGLSFNKDGTPSRTTLNAGRLQTIEGFGALMMQIEEQIARIGEAIKNGDCRILPLVDSSCNTDACQYCDMKPICRNFKKFRSSKSDAEGENENA